MRNSTAAFLAFASLAVAAAAQDAQSPGTPGTQPPPNLQTPDGQTSSLQNPGSTLSPSQTPGTEFPSQNPTAPNQTGTLNGRTALRSRAQILTDIRAAVMQVPSGTQPGSTPAGATEAPIRDLRVFRRAGKIVLTGTVASQLEKDAAGERAAQAAAGQQIVNQLQVK